MASPVKLIALIFVSLLAFYVDGANAQPLSQWKISCGADPGSIKKSGTTWTFRASSNHCDPGAEGAFAQRAEINSGKVPPSHKGAYRFTSFVSMRASASERFKLFQIHDARQGCAPPLMLEVQANGQLTLTGDFKIGDQPGEECVKDVLQTSGPSRAKFKRDGTEYRLDVIISFDGGGGFEALVYLDESLQITGRYQYETGKGYFRSKHFYFKHGVYSKMLFDYELISRDMKVVRIQLSE